MCANCRIASYVRARQRFVKPARSATFDPKKDCAYLVTPDASHALVQHKRIALIVSFNTRRKTQSSSKTYVKYVKTQWDLKAI
jgi:hypothetical protein